MEVKNDKSTRFMDEVGIIPKWLFVLAGVALVAAVVGLMFISTKDKTAPPMWAMGLLGIIPGTFLGCYILLIGYINRDSGRRNMSRLAWTLIAIFIPNALGIVLYFVLRKPRAEHCPQCGAVVEPGFGFCPHCRHRLGLVCPHCQRSVQAGDKFCPYCGGELATAQIDHGESQRSS